MKGALALLLVIASTGATLGAEHPQQAFIKSWEGRTVTVRSPLYSLVYDERGTFGRSRRGLREGLVVATTSRSSYLQFDGRHGRADVIQRDAHRVVAAVNHTYEPDGLDVPTYRKLEAIRVTRYDPGVELLLTRVRVERDEVRLAFAAATGGEVITGIRIKMPMPLSKSFNERSVVEALIQRFVQIRQP